MIKDFLKDPMGWFRMDLQLFAEGDAGDGGSGGSGGDSGSGDNKIQWVEKMDPVTKQMVKIPADLEKVLGHFISSTRNDVEGKYKPMLEQLESEKGDFVAIKAEYDKLKESMMTAEEKAQARAKQVIEEHQKKEKIATDEAQAWKSRFEKSTIRNDIYAAFDDTKLCNPFQVAMLFEMEGKAKIREVVDQDGKNTGDFETIVSLALENDKGETEYVEGTPTALFKRWIKLARNAHHIPAAMGNGGSGSRQGSQGKDSGIDQTLHPSERLKQYRASQGQS